MTVSGPYDFVQFQRKSKSVLEAYKILGNRIHQHSQGFDPKILTSPFGLTTYDLSKSCLKSCIRYATSDQDLHCLRRHVLKCEQVYV